MDLTYPRADFMRANLEWKSLNGAWDFLFDDSDIGLSQKWHFMGLPTSGTTTTSGEQATKREIQVPFVFQSKASGINEQGKHEVLWYERFIEDLRTEEHMQLANRLLLRFGAVDYIATVWLNGILVGSHRGGHVPFDIDITEAIELLSMMDQSLKQYRLTVRIFDSATDTAQPRGKQYWNPVPESIWYTPSSGIWQHVWLESVPSTRIADSSSGTILRSHDIESGELDARIAVLYRGAGQTYSVEVVTSLKGREVASSGKRRLPHDEDFVRVGVNVRLSDQQIQELPKEYLEDIPTNDRSCWRNGVALWSPEHPTLYAIAIRLYDQHDELVDEVRTTTGMRSLNWTTGNGTFRLNGQPYFQALFLDQGYWPETLMTPPSSDALRKDIEFSKAMGFNGCRKHQKVEDPMFLYWADRLGFLVWGEMASCHRFSNDMVERFDQEWMETVQRDINHPCVVAWTPANESWGYPHLDTHIRQRDHLRSLYYRTKTLDWTRPINDNCGWEHVATDLSTFHAYQDGDGMAKRCVSIKSVLDGVKSHQPMFLRPIHGTNGEYDKGSEHERGMPVLCTELGGVNISATVDHKQRENWGYTTASDSSDLVKRVERIIMGTVESGIVCGIVWTQLTDIEQEQNGLYTWDRRPKLPADQVKAIMDRAREAYHSNRA